jgi:uncharacterized CHY-type Zn-finger protein
MSEKRIIDEFVSNIIIELEGVKTFEEWKSCYRAFYLLVSSGYVRTDLANALLEKQVVCTSVDEEFNMQVYKNSLSENTLKLK